MREGDFGNTQNATDIPVRPLRDICDVISGQHIMADDYNLNGIGIGYLTGPSDFGPLHPVITKWTEHPKRTAKDGDILITVKGSGVGKINFVRGPDVAISRQLAAIRVTRGDPRFIYLFLSLQNHHFQNLANGAAIPGLSRNDILDLAVPLPPLPEQQRIVAILDEVFEGIDAAVANAERNLANARELFESYLNRVFTKKGEGWVEAPLADFCESVSTGPFGALLHKSDYVTEGIPLVNPINIVNNRIEPDKTKLISEDNRSRLSAYVLREGDIVIGRRGEIGRCAVVRQQQDGWVCGTGCFFVRPSSQVESAFLAYLIRSRPYKERLEAVSTGATMPNLSNRALSQLQIAIPETSAQLRSLDRFDKLRRASQCLESTYTHKLAALAELKQSILQKAFSGDLTPEAVGTMEETV